MMLKNLTLSAAALFALVGNASALRAISSKMAQLEEQQAFDTNNPEHIKLLQENIESKMAFALDMQGLPSELMHQTPSTFDPALIKEYYQQQTKQQIGDGNNNNNNNNNQIEASENNRDLQDGEPFDPFEIIIPIVNIINVVDICGTFNTILRLFNFLPSSLLGFLCPDPIPLLGGGGLFGCDYEDAFKIADLICTTILGLTDTVTEALLAIFTFPPREASCSELCTTYYLLVCSDCEKDPVDPYAA